METYLIIALVLALAFLLLKRPIANRVSAWWWDIESRTQPWWEECNPDSKWNELSVFAKHKAWREASRRSDQENTDENTYVCHTCKKYLTGETVHSTCDGVDLCADCHKELVEEGMDEKWMYCQSGFFPEGVAITPNQCIEACGRDKAIECSADQCG